jgi:hypothetical protein
VSPRLSCARTCGTDDTGVTQPVSTPFSVLQLQLKACLWRSWQSMLCVRFDTNTSICVFYCDHFVSVNRS